MTIQTMGNTMKKFERLVSLIYLLKRGPLRTKQIAEKLGTTERTVYRDINDLNEALDGYVRILTTDEGHSLDETVYAPPLHFISDEIEALQTAVQAMDSNNPHFQLAHQALSKLQTHAGARPGLANLEQHLEVMQPLAKDRVPVKLLQEIENHLQKKHWLALDYFSHNSGVSKTIHFAPYALIFRKNAWYLLGDYREKNEIVLLRAYRIHKIKVLDERFNIPKDFSVSKYFKSHWEVFDGTPEEIQLRFINAAAWRIQEMIWHKSQRFEKNSENSVDLYLKVPINPEFISWILGWGGECQIIKPNSLYAQLQSQVQHMHEVYKELR